MWPSLVALLALVAHVTAQGGALKASAYTDANTGIAFTGLTHKTGYRFGMVLPSTPTSDFIVQLVSPLLDGGGWAGIDFGVKMSGPLLLVAWPNHGKVIVAPRLARGYEASDTVPYTASVVTTTAIDRGTYVNATHLSATFLCHGCINKNSFAAGAAASTFSYAYSLVPVAEPGNKDTLLSTHVSRGEPMGVFAIDLNSARSDRYATFAAMAGMPASSGEGGAGGAGGTSTPTSTSIPTPTSTPTTTDPITSAGSESSASPTAESSQGGAGKGQSDHEEVVTMSGKVRAGIAVTGVLYLLQALSVF